MSDLVGNPEDRFSRVVAHLIFLIAQPQYRDRQFVELWLQSTILHYIFLFVYSPFHWSLPFQHLVQSSLCRSGNFLFYLRTETVSQVPGVLKIYSAFIFR